MKKYFLVVGLLLLPFTFAYAQGDGADFKKIKTDDSNLMNVKIVNLGSENCVLTQHKVTVGSLNNSSFPAMLPADGSPSVFQMVGPKSKHYDAVVNAEVSLTYQCGTYKTFTFDMKQYFKKKYYHGNLDVSMKNAVDVFEAHETTRPQRKGYTEPRDSKGGFVSWVVRN